jgi:predicted NBD/HSP70 family sugar kinase
MTSPATARVSRGAPSPAREARIAPPAAPPGTPGLLRELNDRAALEVLLPGEPLTRARLATATGMSKVTVAQMLARLQDRGLVYVTGEAAGGRGPNAALYSVVPSSAYAAAMQIESGLVSTAVADVTGRVIAETREGFGACDPVELACGAADRACRKAGVPVSALSSLVVGSPGVVNPSTGDPWLAAPVRAWDQGVVAALRGALRDRVVIENEVNLAAMAERSYGAAVGVDDFVLISIGAGLGLAIVLDGRLHRGAAGAAGQIEYLQVPGARSAGRRANELPADLTHRLVPAVTNVCAVLDPELVVLGGEVGLAGGTELASRVAAAVTRLCLARPRIVPAEVSAEPVLRGALLTAVDHARANLLADVSDHARKYRHPNAGEPRVMRENISL